MHPTTFQVNSAWYDSEMAEKRWEFLDSLHSLLDKLEPLLLRIATFALLLYALWKMVFMELGR